MFVVMSCCVEQVWECWLTGCASAGLLSAELLRLRSNG